MLTVNNLAVELHIKLVRAQVIDHLATIIKGGMLSKIFQQTKNFYW